MKQTKKKAIEVLKAYDNNERTFNHLDLCGEIFNKKDLSGADFSHSYLRGTKFINCILKDTIFKDVRAGIRTRNIIIYLVVLGFCSSIIGVLLSSLSIFITQFNIQKQHFTSLTLIFFSIIFVISMIYYFHQYFEDNDYINSGEIVEPLIILSLYLITKKYIRTALFLERFLCITVIILLCWQAVKLKILITLMTTMIVSNIQKLPKYIYHLIFFFFCNFNFRIFTVIFCF